MPADWERRLARWEAHGVIDPAAASRIRSFEASATTGRGSRWLTWVAWGLGAFLVGAGVLLLVSTTWDDLSPLARLAVIVAGIAAVHTAGGATAARWPLASAVLHLTGTVGLGPAIFTAGDVFGMNGSWATAVLMWALGAAVAWRMRQERAYVVLLAILAPVWLTGEWLSAAGPVDIRNVLVIEAGWFLTCVAYATAPGHGAVPRALAWTGHVLWLPVAAFLAVRAGIRVERILEPIEPLRAAPSLPLLLVGWVVALLAPVLAAVALRGRRAWMNAALAGWVVVLANLPPGGPKLILYAWLALGAMAYVGWALAESGVVRLNLGVAAFGLIVVAFYFDHVMGQVGRSFSLIGLGLLFLGGGYVLERARRRMVERVSGGVS